MSCSYFQHLSENTRNGGKGDSENGRISGDMQGGVDHQAIEINGKCLHGIVKAAESVLRKTSQLVRETLKLELELLGDI